MDYSQLKNQYIRRSTGRYLFSIWMMCISLFIPMITTAQESNAEEAESTIRSRMSLSANQFPDQSIELKGLLRAKVDGRYMQIPNAKLSFYLVKDEEEKLLGAETTGEDGVAAVSVNQSDFADSTDEAFVFLARFEGNDRLSESESDLSIIPAMLVMEPVEGDSTYSLRFKASFKGADEVEPYAGAPIKVLVKRMFSSLQVASGETDEEGELEVEFPNDLYGDDQSNLSITALIEDTDDYGTLKATTVQAWGKPVSFADTNLPKALWSPHPPTWMVITFFVLMGTVWGHYVVIIFNLFSIRSEKPHST